MFIIWNPLTIFAKSSILNVWQGSEFPFGCNHNSLCCLKTPNMSKKCLRMFWAYNRSFTENLPLYWKKRPWHRCFPVNIAKFFRELFFKLLTIFAKSTITGSVLNTPLCIYLLGLTYSLWWRLFQTTIHCQRIWIVCIHWISLLLLHSDIITSL